MKKNLLFILLFLSVTCPLYSQKSYSYFGGGLNGSIVRVPGLNKVIDRYNETRSGANSASLTKKMGKMDFMQGYAFCFGGLSSETGIFYDFRLSLRNGTVNAEGIDLNGSAGSRELKFKVNTFNMSGGYTPINSALLDFGIGLSFDLGQNSAFTSVNKEKMEKISGEFALATSVVSNLYLSAGAKFPIALLIRPYYQFQFIEMDFAPVNQKINPATAAADTEKNFKSPATNFGVEATAIIMLRAKKQNSVNIIRRK